MPLIPVTSLLATTRAAMQRDPEGTSALIDEAVSSWMVEEIDRYAEPLAKCFQAQSLESIRLAKRSLGRYYVETIAKGHYPDDAVQQQAEWLAGLEVLVSKAGEWTAERRAAASEKAKRQLESGRKSGKRGFGFLVDTQSEEDVRGTHPTQLSPHAAGLVVSDETGQIRVNDQLAGTEGEHALARHQSQWRQLNDGLQSMAADMGRDAGKVDAMIEIDSPNGRRNEKINLGSAAGNLAGLGERFNPLTDTIRSVQLVAPVDASPELSQKVNVYNQVGYAAAGNVPSWLRRLSASDWQGLLGPGNPQDSGVTRMFDRVTAGSSVLRALPGVDDKYAEWARFVGTVGPEADRALGPHIRRAAYRYRGTEKTPDAELRADLSTKPGTAYAGVIALADNEVPAKEVRDIADRMPDDGNPVISSMLNRARKGAQGDSLRMGVASDVAVGDLLRYLPDDPFTAKLSEKSGHVLPSHGVLINHKGEVVSQSVGSADDHYLPFDLKNLAALRGGQYVRTRVAGGLTGEDVYTAIQAGARMVTVASSSGVFTMEMDPSFRGARGNSDKAREMYTRYLQILDAVEASGLYLQDVPGPMKAKLRQDAANSIIPSGDKKADAEAIQTAYDRKLEAMRRDMATLDSDELERIQAEAEDEVLNNPQTKRMSNPQIKRMIDDVYDDKVEAARADKVQSLRLNAAGYDMALKTLQQQYPYFIRDVSYTSLKDLGGTARLRANESGEDRGYVRPGGLKPESVRSGFYETGNPHGPGPKRPAGEPAGAGAKPGAAAGGGTAPGAPGGAAKPSAAPPAAPAGGKLQSALAANQTLVAGAGQQAYTELAQALPMMGKLIDNTYSTTAYNPEGTKAQRAAWLLDKIASNAGPEVLNQPGAMEALSDPKAVLGGLGQIFATPPPPGNLDEVIDPDAVGGATTGEELARWIGQQAQLVADIGTGGSPFAGVYTEGQTDPLLAGTKPMMFEDMDFADPVQVDDFIAQGHGQKLWAEAQARGWVKGDDSYAPRQAVAADVKDSLDTIKALQEAAANVRNLDAPHEAGNLAEYVARKVPAKGKETGPERAARAMGAPVTNVQQLTPEALAQRALELQRAWSLLEVDRAVSSLGLRQDGGGLPKAQLLRRAPRPQEAAKALEPDLDDPLVVASILASVGIV